MTDRPTAAMLVIGDEILSGRTRDSNMNHLARVLTEHGIDLREARMIPDVHDMIVANLRDLAARHDHLFTSGGIGPTHDDITADAVAAAFGVGIDIRDDARALLAIFTAARGTELNAARLRMARIPDGARLIDNPVSAAPGFTLENVHVMAGVPSVFEAMVAGLVPTLAGGPQLLSRSVQILRPEGDVAAALARLADAYPSLSVGSYPFNRDGIYGVNAVIRGTDASALDAAEAALRADFPDAA